MVPVDIQQVLTAEEVEPGRDSTQNRCWLCGAPLVTDGPICEECEIEEREAFEDYLAEIAQKRRPL
jgi:predicted amidophosphoribosyltransferase